MRKPKVARTFGEYADMELIPYFMSRLEYVSRLDIVWNQYVFDSLKKHARRVRGEGTREEYSNSKRLGYLFLRINRIFLFCSRKVVKSWSRSQRNLHHLPWHCLISKCTWQLCKWKFYHAIMKKQIPGYLHMQQSMGTRKLAFVR